MSIIKTFDLPFSGAVVRGATESDGFTVYMSNKILWRVCLERTTAQIDMKISFFKWESFVSSDHSFSVNFPLISCVSQPLRKQKVFICTAEEVQLRHERAQIAGVTHLLSNGVILSHEGKAALIFDCFPPTPVLIGDIKLTGRETLTVDSNRNLVFVLEAQYVVAFDQYGNKLYSHTILQKLRKMTPTTHNPPRITVIKNKMVVIFLNAKNYVFEYDDEKITFVYTKKGMKGEENWLEFDPIWKLAATKRKLISLKSNKALMIYDCFKWIDTPYFWFKDLNQMFRYGLLES